MWQCICISKYYLPQYEKSIPQYIELSDQLMQKALPTVDNTQGEIEDNKHHQDNQSQSMQRP